MLKETLNYLHIPSIENITKSVHMKKQSKTNQPNVNKLYCKDVSGSYNLKYDDVFLDIIILVVICQFLIIICLITLLIPSKYHL